MDTGKILLVDDEKLVLGTISRILRDAGYRVLEASGGDEALDLTGRCDDMIHLAIVDVSMPGMSGIELSGLLLERHQIPSLFLSAYSDREIVEDAVNKGALGYLVKPMDGPHLIPAVQAALARAKDFQALFQAKCQLETALSNKRKTSIAVGILMERRGLGEQKAFEALRQHARSHQQRVEDVSKNLVAALDDLNRIETDT